MKKIILALVLSGIFISVNAQTDKGDWIVGGRVDLNTADNNTHIGFTPNAATFVAHNFAVGGDLTLDYTKGGSTKITNFGIGPMARYYFTNAMARPLLQASFGFISTKVSDPGFSSTNSGFNIFLGGGAAVFINDNVALEILMGYAHTKYKDFNGSGGFNLGIGFQVYLSKGQMNKVRGK
jgi:hypothetical protein